MQISIGKKNNEEALRRAFFVVKNVLLV